MYPNSSPLNFMSVGSGNGAEQFPDPFMDVASRSMPHSWRRTLYWCEHIFERFGTYRMAMERIISYFLTSVEVTGKNVSDEEKEKYKKFFTETLNVLSLVQNMMRDRMCFHGDVTAVTRGGVFKLRDLVGKTVDVLSQGGVYRPATFKSFGRQELLEVKFSDGRTILATPEHEWIAKNCSDKEVVVPTTKLRAGYRIERTVAPRPERNADFYEGVRHGFTFCDGSAYNDGKQTEATFFGTKDADMLQYFQGHGSEPKPDAQTGSVTIYGLPGHYKQLPANDASASYWYGFVCGFLAADGSVDTYGCSVLTQASEATLAAVVAQLPRIGMAAGPVRGHWRQAKFVRKDGKVDVYEGDMYYATLLKRFMLPQDILLSEHRQKFEENASDTAYGRYIGVESVRPTGIVDEVFCCVEMETHTFVVDQAILTKQCYGNSFCSVLVPFKRMLMSPWTGHMYSLAEVFNNSQFAFEFTNHEFTATCPVTKRRGPWKVVDHVDDKERKLKVKRWSPHEIELLHDLWTDDVAYLWRIPEDYRRQVSQGKLYHLERVPMPVLQAIKTGAKYFRFHPDVIFHMREPTLGGQRNRGWACLGSSATSVRSTMFRFCGGTTSPSRWTT